MTLGRPAFCVFSVIHVGGVMLGMGVASKTVSLSFWKHTAHLQETVSYITAKYRLLN